MIHYNIEKTDRQLQNERSAKLWEEMTKGKVLPISREQEAINRRRAEHKNRLQREDEYFDNHKSFNF